MRMLTEAGITPVILHSIHEQPRDEQGMLPAEAVAPLTSWLEQLGADAPARAAIARRTLAGAITGTGNSLQELADAQTRQVETYTGLETAVTLAYEDALARVEDSLTDGSLLRGEVLARWHDFVGTGDFFRSLENRIGLSVEAGERNEQGAYSYRILTRARTLRTAPRLVRSLMRLLPQKYEPGKVLYLI